jgi:hypothetical protein
VAKASNPVRLQADLMERAVQAGARHHRSAAQQIEYWAALGQQVAGLVDPDSLLAVQCGVARLRVEPIQGTPLDSRAVFAALDADRRSGALARAVTTAAERYQACADHPGLLERLGPDGSRVIGQFRDGQFQPLQPPAA